MSGDLGKCRKRYEIADNEPVCRTIRCMPRRKKASPTKVLGWCEWAALPTLTGSTFRSKIDTGAETCALHSPQLRLSGGDALFKLGKERVRIPVKEMRVVKSSNGESQVRPVVELEVVVGSDRRAYEFTLTNRASMKFPILLGRNFLADHFVVDVSRAYVQGKPKVFT